MQRKKWRRCCLRNLRDRNTALLVCEPIAGPIGEQTVNVIAEVKRGNQCCYKHDADDYQDCRSLADFGWQPPGWRGHAGMVAWRGGGPGVTGVSRSRVRREMPANFQFQAALAARSSDSIARRYKSSKFSRSSRSSLSSFLSLMISLRILRRSPRPSPQRRLPFSARSAPAILCPGARSAPRKKGSVRRGCWCLPWCPLCVMRS